MLRACAGLEALEPRERAGAARRLPGRGAAAAGGPEVRPRRAALRAGGPAAPARDGVRRRHAQQPLHHDAGAKRAGVRAPRGRPCGPSHSSRPAGEDHGSRGPEPHGGSGSGSSGAVHQRSYRI